MSIKPKHPRRPPGAFPGTQHASGHFGAEFEEPSLVGEEREGGEQLFARGDSRDGREKLPVALAVRLYNAIVAMVTQPIAAFGELLRHPWATLRQLGRRRRPPPPLAPTFSVHQGGRAR